MTIHHKNDPALETLHEAIGEMLSVWSSEHGVLTERDERMILKAMMTDAIIPNHYEIQAMVGGVAVQGNDKKDDASYSDTYNDRLGDDAGLDFECPPWVRKKFPAMQALVESIFGSSLPPGPPTPEEKERLEQRRAWVTWLFRDFTDAQESVSDDWLLKQMETAEGSKKNQFYFRVVFGRPWMNHGGGWVYWAEGAWWAIAPNGKSWIWYKKEEDK